MTKKIIYFGVAAVVLVSVGIVMLLIFNSKKEPSRPSYADDEVFVRIGEQYKEEFLAREFTVEHFKWSNIESIEYSYTLENTTKYDEKTGESINIGWTGRIDIYLKKHGTKEVNAILKHLETLEFVYSAAKAGKIYPY